MPDITIDEARAARNTCEQAITATIAEFMKQTGLDVTSVDLLQLESSSGEPAAPIVTLQVELP